tara:strand:+ start:480 stop:734 length:255 start_codon:yes stop_codon:yes gene_type:complete
MSKSIIDSNVRKAKDFVLEQQRTEHGYNLCEDCGTSAGWLDCSHTISVDECQKRGQAELAFDAANIRVLCRFCHIKHDSKSKLI